MHAMRRACHLWGAKHLRSPPSACQPGTPASLRRAILARPSASTRQVRVVEAASGASGVAPGAAPAATKTIDPELEARRKKAEEERVARQKADEDKQAKVRADNCERARGGDLGAPDFTSIFFKTRSRSAESNFHKRPLPKSIWIRILRV